MSNTKSKALVSVAIVAQQTTNDCAIAAVAMLTNLPYPEVFQAHAALSKRVQKSGASNRTIKAMIKRLGFNLRHRVEIDLDEDTGLLLLDSTDEKKMGHTALLFRGTLVDPGTGLLWDPEVFLRENSFYRVEGLLELV